MVFALSLKLSALVASECAGVLQSVTRAREDPALPFAALARLCLVTQAGALAFFHLHPMPGVGCEGDLVPGAGCLQAAFVWGGGEASSSSSLP